MHHRNYEIGDFVAPIGSFLFQRIFIYRFSDDLAFLKSADSIQ